jgi:hypothetical protein
MYKGENIISKDFYKLLYESFEFTSELGKIALVSGYLESELKQFLKINKIEGKYERATLGTLTKLAEKKNVLDKNMIMALKESSVLRNYITHNIYALFMDRVDETILEKENLIDSDVELYIERAWQLKENINGLANIIHAKNETFRVER